MLVYNRVLVNFLWCKITSFKYSVVYISEVLYQFFYSCSGVRFIDQSPFNSLHVGSLNKGLRSVISICGKPINRLFGRECNAVMIYAWKVSRTYFFTCSISTNEQTNEQTKKQTLFITRSVTTNEQTNKRMNDQKDERFYTLHIYRNLFCDNYANTRTKSNSS